MSIIKQINVNGQIYDLAGSDAGNIFTPPIEVTYAELKALRDEGSLTPLQRYTITDFVSVFNEHSYTDLTDTRIIKTANHAFKITVQANSESSFYEEAMASKIGGDTYFDNCDLSKWKLWYTMDYDKKYEGFISKDDPSFKGFIYRMIDEFNNDVNFDFKNALFTVKADYFHYFGNSKDDIVHYYLFSYFDSKGDLTAVTDHTVNTYNKAVHDNTIISEAPALGGLPTVLGAVKGNLTPITSDIIAYNSVKYARFFCVAYSKILGGVVAYNEILRANTGIRNVCKEFKSNNFKAAERSNSYTASFGHQNYEANTAKVIMGSISGNNLDLKGGLNIAFYTLSTLTSPGLEFTENTVQCKISGQFYTTGNIKNTVFLGALASDVTYESGNIETKVVFFGDSVKIIDPFTL